MNIFLHVAIILSAVLLKCITGGKTATPDELAAIVDRMELAHLDYYWNGKWSKCDNLFDYVITKGHQVHQS